MALTQHDEWLTTTDIAAEFGMSVTTAWRMLQEPGCPTWAIGNRRKVKRSEFVAWLRDRPVRGAGVLPASERQRERRASIVAYVREYQGPGPTRAEIAQHAGVSEETVSKDMRWLRDQRQVHWTPMGYRVLTPDEAAALWALVVEQVDAEATEDERPYLAEWRKAAETQV